MLRLTRRNRKRISNRLAVFAGLMLLISSLAGMHRASLQAEASLSELAENESTLLEQPVANNVAQNRARKKKGFKVSLFLFRLD